MTVSVDQFGRDHWSLFAYVECRVVDDGGIPNNLHMRCDPARHPGLAGSYNGHRLTPDRKYPTRLAGGALLNDHDDWDCADDLEAAGLIQIKGTGIHPVWRLTKLGRRVAAKLREHKQKGGQFSTFTYKKPRRKRPPCSSHAFTGSSTASSPSTAPSTSGPAVGSA